jgi:4-amino-4-deoxy-L-arabinose transferase-like glycosyltransferase
MHGSPAQDIRLSSLQARVPGIGRSPVTAGLLLAGLLPIYLNAHLALRLFESESLRWDEAEQALFTQQIALGYNDQPPVYSWLLSAVFQVVGPSLIGAYLLKAVVLAAIYVGQFALCRKLGCGNLTLPAVLSLLLTPYFAWSALIDGAHTLFVSSIVPFAFITVYRLLDRPTSAGFVVLGVLLGLGFLAKYSFALLALALPIAIATIPTLRCRLRDMRILLTIAVAALIVLPHVAWMSDNWELIRARPIHRGGVDSSQAFVGRLAAGFGSLATALLFTAGPMVAVIVALFPGQCRRIATECSQSDHVQLLGRLLIIVAGILLLLVVLGITRFRTHWLIPAVILIPPYAFARMAEAQPSPTRVRALLVLVACGVAVTMAARLVGISMEARDGGKYWGQDRLHSALAHALLERGLENATIVGDHPLTCGNLRVSCPECRIVCTYYPAFIPADASTADCCCVVWDASYQTEMPKCLEDWIACHQLADRLDWSTAMYIDLPTSATGNGMRRVGLMRLRPPPQK